MTHHRRRQHAGKADALRRCGRALAAYVDGTGDRGISQTYRREKVGQPSPSPSPNSHGREAPTPRRPDMAPSGSTWLGTALPTTPATTTWLANQAGCQKYFLERDYAVQDELTRRVYKKMVA